MVLLSIFSSFSTVADKYDYIMTPNVDQIADQQDQDSDGVINARDLCPDTPIGAEIDNDGCGTMIKLKDSYALHILFENNSDVIEPSYEKQITGMSSFLKKYPTTSIEIQGYASKVGSQAHNLKLSQRRAKQVQRKLIHLGINKNRIRLIGYGDTRLSIDGSDEISHALNRKVTATVVGHEGKLKKEWNIFTTISKES